MVIVAALVVLAVAGGVTLWLAGDDDEAPSPESGGDTSRSDTASSGEATVHGYFQAFLTGDCDSVVDHLSTTASDGVPLDPEVVLNRCHDEAPDGQDLDLTVTVDIVSEDEDRLDVDATVIVDGEATNAPWTLVREQSAWKMDATQVLDSWASPVERSGLETVALGQVLPGFGIVRAANSGDVDLAGAVAMDPGDDPDAALVDAGFEAGFVRLFENESGDRVVLILLDFTDDAGALGYAQQMHDQILSRNPDGADAAVPGNPDALGIALDGADTSSGVAVQVGEGVLVRAEVIGSPGQDRLGQAAEVLQAQLGRL